MPPTFFQHHATYQRLRDTISVGYRLLANSSRRIEGSNISDGLIAKDGVSVGFTGRWVRLGLCSTTFRRAIPIVIQTSPEEQMIRATTGRVVAPMKNPHSIRNRAVGNLPSQPMTQNVLVVVANNSVAELMASSRPFPATFSLSNSRPEGFFKSHSVGPTFLSKRVTPFTPSTPMRKAPATSTGRFRTQRAGGFHMSSLTQMVAF